MKRIRTSCIFPLCQRRKRYIFGFTLIELLIVISIIGILTAIGVVSFSNVARKGRDARRMSDMKAAQNAFEQYFSAHSEYGVGCDAMDDSLPSGWSGMIDPKTGSNYPCTSTVTGYCACADMEDETKSTHSDSACGTGTPKTHYCVQNLQ